MLQLLAPFIQSRIMWHNENILARRSSHGLKCSVYIKNKFLSVFVHINVQGFNEGFLLSQKTQYFFLDMIFTHGWGHVKRLMRYAFECHMTDIKYVDINIYVSRLQEGSEYWTWQSSRSQVLSTQNRVPDIQEAYQYFLATYRCTTVWQ